MILNRSVTMEKLLKELRISFIILNKEKYENIYLSEIENDSLNLNSIVSGMLKSLVGDDQEYRDFQSFYFNSLEYNTWVGMKKEHVSEVLGRLRNDRVVHSDDMDFFRQYYLFYSSIEYFRKSWYCLPSLEFSQDFYQNIMPNYFQCLLNHENGPAKYQYQLERISLSDLNVKGESHGNAVHQRYYLLNKKLLDDLLTEMKGIKNGFRSDVVKYEYDLMLDALTKAIDAKVYIIITSF